MILPPGEIQALWSQNHDTAEILHAINNVVSRVENGMTCRRTGCDRYGIQKLAIQTGQRDNRKNMEKHEVEQTKRCRAPPEMWQAKQNSSTRKQSTTKGEREGQENRSTTKISSGQPQQFVVGEAY